jgi:GntR family transcriptional repressor for pyruvate dehydrogenase complex
MSSPKNEARSLQAWTPAQPVRAFEAVLAQLREAIVSGALSPGDRLPNQRDLARQLGVSRSSVLQAMRVLERTGLVEVKPGARGGAFVRATDALQLVEGLALLLELDQVSVDELIEFRESLEGQNAAWAAERRTESDLAELQSIVARVAELRVELREATGQGPNSVAHVWSLLLAQDALFHEAVGRAAHNRAAHAVMRGVLGSLNRQLQKVPDSTADLIYDDLAAIADAIAAGDAERGRARMRGHIREFFEITDLKRSGASGER